MVQIIHKNVMLALDYLFQWYAKLNKEKNDQTSYGNSIELLLSIRVSHSSFSIWGSLVSTCRRRALDLQQFGLDLWQFGKKNIFSALTPIAPPPPSSMCYSRFYVALA